MKKLNIYILAMLFLTTAGINAQIVKVDRTYGPKTTAPKTTTTVVTHKYYYYPDIQTYYDAPSKVYFYNNNGTWVRTAALPVAYQTYNIRTGRKVYLTDYNGNTPYVLFKEHKVKYKGKPWKANGHDNGLHKGHYKGHKGKK